MKYDKFIPKTDFNLFEIDFDIVEKELLSVYPILKEFKAMSINTPLQEVLGVVGCAPIFAKMECDSGSGSVKGRTAYCLLIKALAYNNFSTDFHLLEYSGGNLALSLSLMCNKLGIKNTLVVSSALPKSSVEKMHKLGSQVVRVDTERGFWGVMETAFSIYDDNPSYLFTYQHEEYLNTQFHRDTTAKEAIDALSLQDNVTVKFICSVGTGGTFSGFYKALSQTGVYSEFWLNMPEELHYADYRPPNSRPKFAGSGGMGCSREQPLLANIPINGQYTVSYSDAIAAKRAYFELTGKFIGSSAAANWLSALKLTSCNKDKNALILTVFPCGGSSEENIASLSSEYDSKYRDIISKYGLTY